MPSCCLCNGRNTVCKRCVCVRAGRPCTSCLPMKFSKCVNLLSSRAASQSVLPAGRPVLSGGSTASDLSAHVSSLSDEAPRFDSCVDLNDTDSACAKTLTETADEQLDIDPTIDGLMCQACDEPLLLSAGPPVVLHGIHAGLQLFIMQTIIILCPVALLGDSILICSINNCNTLFGRRMSMWCDQQFDVLLQEAIRCNQSLRNTHRSSAKNKTAHVIRV